MVRKRLLQAVHQKLIVSLCYKVKEATHAQVASYFYEPSQGEISLELSLISYSPTLIIQPTGRLVLTTTVLPVKALSMACCR